MDIGAHDRIELFRSLFESASDAILIVGADGRIVLANAECERLLGYSPSELSGMPVEVLIPARFANHPRQRSEYAANPRPRLMGRGLELMARRADGQEIPVDISLTPANVSGQPLIACAIRDFRERSHGRESLRVQTTALRSAANGIVITDRAGTIIWVNPAACAITGYASDELIGQHTRLLKSGEHPAEFYTALWRTVTRGETWSGTIVNRRKDGSHYHEQQTIAPVVDEQGVITHFIAIKQDVSEQRRTQEALALAHEELEARLQEIESLNRQLHEQTIRDPLTQLHNRRYFDETLARETARMTRDGTSLAIAAIDIDHFKHVNDTWGHAVGDQVLQRLADVLRANVRASDLLCRVGGEEFIVLMPGASLRIALERAEQWRAGFEAARVTGGAGIDVDCTISIGIAMHGAGSDSIDTSLRRADAALYAAKDAGRNRIVTAGDGLVSRGS